MDKLPDFFWADRLTPVNFYGYVSSTREDIFVMDVNKDSGDDNYMEYVQRFNDLKRKCMAMCIDMRRRKTDVDPVWVKDRWDNKIVIECKTETGATIFIGYYDFTYTIGISVWSKDGRIPRPYRTVIDPHTELL